MLTRPSTHFLDGTGLLLNDDNHTDLYLFVSCRYMHTRVSQKFHTSLSLLPFPKYLYLPTKSGGIYQQEASHCCPVI